MKYFYTYKNNKGELRKQLDFTHVFVSLILLIPLFPIVLAIAIAIEYISNPKIKKISELEFYRLKVKELSKVK